MQQIRIVFFSAVLFGSLSCVAHELSGGADKGSSPASARVCGGPDRIECPADRYCDFSGASCGLGDDVGTCRLRPAAPCGGSSSWGYLGCDGLTYSSECDANFAGYDTSLASPESCRPQTRLILTGECLEVLGYGWDDVGDCRAHTGCACEGEDCEALYATKEECVSAHNFCPVVVSPQRTCRDAANEAECGAIGRRSAQPECKWLRSGCAPPSNIRPGACLPADAASCVDDADCGVGLSCQVLWTSVCPVGPFCEWCVDEALYCMPVEPVEE